MSISQSRANSRGPLIAVIKIEIYDDQVDRIFLHQNDDDYKLAQQFQQKHKLSPRFVQHIYLKVKASRDSLHKESITKTPLPAALQRNSYFNQSNYTATPSILERQNTYRTNNDSFPTPFDRINKYTPIRQDTQENQIQSLYEGRGKKNQEREGNNTKHYNTREQQRLFKNFNEERQNLNQQSTKNKDTKNSNSSGFQTFMLAAERPKSNQDLFQKYMKQRKIQKSAGLEEPKRLIEKNKPRTNSNFQSNPISETLHELQKQINNNLNQAKAESGYYEIYRQSLGRKSHNDSEHYSFNQDKPSRVKILRRDQMESLNSSKKSLNKKQKQRIANQVTNRLYNESDIKKNYLNKIKQRAKIEKLQKEDKQLTHKPQINKVSQIIAADRYGKLPLQDYLIDFAKKSEAKKQTERTIKAEKQMENCTFKPYINVISQKLVRDSSKSYLKQSNQKSMNSCSKKHTQSQTAFRPSLNKMSQEIVKIKRQGNFEQRLKGFLEQKNNKLSQMTRQKILKEKLDQSGQQLYQPRINSKTTKRSPKGSQIHDYLYQLSKIDKKVPVQEQKPIINQNSQQIVQQMYMKRIAWIFSELDSDQDGFISPKRICIDTIGQHILEVILPVLFEMEEMDIQLNLLDFRNAIRNLHPSLNAHQKSILYNYNNKNLDNNHNQCKKGSMILL